MARILIVDDSSFARRLISHALRNDGHLIVGEASTRRQAIEMYSKLKPDLVTMDIMMPEMNGIDATQEIITNDPMAKVIAISSLKEEAVAFKTIGVGAKSFIVKPFKQEDLQITVRKILAL